MSVCLVGPTPATRRDRFGINSDYTQSQPRQMMKLNVRQTQFCYNDIRMLVTAKSKFVRCGESNVLVKFWGGKIDSVSLV